MSSRLPTPVLGAVMTILLSAFGYTLTGTNDVTLAERPVVLLAEGVGFPEMNHSNARLLPSDGHGGDNTKYLLEHNLAHPRSLAVGDFDEDGVPDLVTGYATETAGFVGLRTGSRWFRYPYSKAAHEARLEAPYVDRAFSDDMALRSVYGRPDFLEAGDFNADGHLDLAFAERDRSHLVMLPGNGDATFGKPLTRDLGGLVIDVVGDDVNRRDGLQDLVVALRRSDTDEIAVFEHPRGALMEEPERIPFGRAITAIATGWVNAGFHRDIAVATGSTIHLIGGRTRFHSHKPDQLTMSTLVEDAGGTVVALAAADVVGSKRRELAFVRDDGRVGLASTESKAFTVTPYRLGHIAPEAVRIRTGRLSTHPKDDFVVMDAANSVLHVFHSTDFGTDAPFPEVAGVDFPIPAPRSIPVVGQPTDVLLLAANGDAKADIVLAIRADGVHAPHSGVAVSVSQPAINLIVTENSDAGDTNPTDTVCLTQNGGCNLNSALSIANRMAGMDQITFAIDVHDFPFGTIRDDLILDGSSRGHVKLNEWLLWVTDNGGGSTFAGLDVVRGVNESSNDGGSTFVNNIFGVFADGTVNSETSANFTALRSDGHTFGGISEDVRNVAGSLLVEGGEVTVHGNHIGVATDGVTPLLTDPNSSSFRDAVDLRAKFNERAPNNRIGGAGPGEGNVISGRYRGISADDQDGLTVQGNMIGTDVSGLSAIPNKSYGIALNQSEAAIGGTVPGARNVISGNGGNGIDLNGLENVVSVLGNYVGTDATGNVALPNQGAGVNARVNPATIGSSDVNGRNILSGNTGSGIVGGNNLRAVGNYIGLGADGHTILGNGEFGATLTGADMQFGGANAGEGNVVVGSGQSGVHFQTSSSINRSVKILGNRIWANAGLGICAGTGCVNPRINDVGDVQEPQNYPELTVAETGDVTVSLSSASNSSFRIELFANSTCDPTGHGEGERLVRVIDPAVTDGSGMFSVIETVTVPPGMTFVTATATSSAGRTSEFSNCAEVGTVGAGLAVSPQEVVIVSGPAKTQSVDVIVENLAGGDLEVTELVFSSTRFSVVNEPTLPFVLGAGQAALLPVTFDPAGGRAEGTLTVRANASGALSEASVTIRTALLTGMAEHGVAIDPVNPVPDEFPERSRFDELSLTGEGLGDVDFVAVEPRDGVTVAGTVSAEDLVVYGLSVQNSAVLGDRDLMIGSTSGGWSANVSDLMGRKFIVTSGVSAFTQVIDAHELHAPYTDVLVADKPGAVRFRFEDDHRLGEQFAGGVARQGVDDIGLATIFYRHQASYTSAELENGVDFLSQPMPGPPPVGESRYQVVLERSSDSAILRAPWVARTAKASRPLRILGVPFSIRSTDDELIEPVDDAVVSSSLDLVRKIYPVSETQYLFKPIPKRQFPRRLEVVEKSLPGGGTRKILTEESQETLRKAIRNLLIRANKLAKRKGARPFNAIAAYIGNGLLNRDTDNDGTIDRNAVGQAYHGGPWLVMAGDNVQSIVAHEIGHRISTALARNMTFGDRLGFEGQDLGDEYNGGSFQCDVNPPVKENKWRDGSIGCPSSPFETDVDGNTTGTFTALSAFDPVNLEPKLSDVNANPKILNYNFMSAAVSPSTMWASRLGYRLLYDNLIPLDESVPKSQGYQTEPIAHLSGRVNKDGSATLDEIILDEADFTTPDEDGPYAVEARDAGNATLQRHTFDLSFIVETEPADEVDEMSFALTIPWPAGTNRIVLTKDAVELASTDISANAPIVDSVEGTAVDDGTGDAIISWSASDEDGDELTYSVLYQPDENSVLPVATGLTETTYRWTPGQFAGSTEPRVTVVASDGVNEGSAEVLLDFTVVGTEGQPPDVVNPANVLLARNYPNPFFGSTTIEFDVPAGIGQRETRIELFDILGRRVRRIDAGTVEAGRHSVVWDGADGLGRRVTPGLYVYVITVGELRVTETLVVGQ